MKLQVLVSSVNQEIMTLADRMHLQTDAIIVNQTDHFGYEEYMHNGRRIQCYEFQEKVWGLAETMRCCAPRGILCCFPMRILSMIRGMSGAFWTLLRRILKQTCCCLICGSVHRGRRITQRRFTGSIYGMRGVIPRTPLRCGGRSCMHRILLFIAVWRRREVQQRGGQSFSEGLSEIRIGGLCSTN